MYNLDINFLNDRGIKAQEASKSTRSAGAGGPVNWTPAIAGLLIGLLFPLLALGGLFWVKRDAGQIAEREATVDSQLAALQQQVAELEAIRQEAREIETDTLALVKVFDKLQPWSAILQDVSNRVPQSVRLAGVEQDAETGAVTLSGNAESYEAVNDFMIKLAASPFFDGEKVVLGNAAIGDDPTQVEITTAENSGLQVEVEPTRVVTYEINAPLGQWSYADDEMVSLLSQLGSEGMLARVEALSSDGLLDKLKQQASEPQLEPTPTEQEAPQS